MLEYTLSQANAGPRTLLTSQTGLENAKALVTQYKQGQIQSMTPELWQAKKIVDSTLHPGQWPFFAQARLGISTE